MCTSIISRAIIRITEIKTHNMHISKEEEYSYAKNPSRPAQNFSGDAEFVRKIVK
jgi:hypothetical protein